MRCYKEKSIYKLFLNIIIGIRYLYTPSITNMLQCHINTLHNTLKYIII